jgi:hypothetical protein
MRRATLGLISLAARSIFQIHRIQLLGKHQSLRGGFRLTRASRMLSLN